MQIHCPQCGVRLNVPENAGGRPARCPQCKVRFRVPDPRTMLDETVTCWLNLDHLHQEEEVEEQHETITGVEPAQASRHPAASSSTLDDDDSEDDLDDLGELVAAEDDGSIDGDPEQAAADLLGGADPTPTEDEDEIPPMPGGPTRVEEPAVTGHHRSGPGTDPPRRAARGSYVIDPDQMAELKRSDAFVQHDPDVIRLHVLDVGAFGVKIAFAARLLDNPVFRASMPMCGVLSGETDKSQLTARPLAWVDKATGHRVNPGELEGRYEMQVRGHESSREIARGMNLMQELPAPFNQPMPYYVCAADAGRAQVHCETVASPHGIQCEVTIPSIRYAMEWVMRVNGVCSEEFLQLEEEVDKYDVAAWKQIPNAVRGRLSVWFDFQPDEQFVAYFNDSDYSTSDAGLGGLVVTTRRLVFCKFHNHGAIDMADAGSLLALESGRFVTLYHRRNGARRKLVRLRRDDLDQLVEVLKGLDAPWDVTIEPDPPAEPADEETS